MTCSNFLYCEKYKLYYFLYVASFLPFISCIFYLASLFLRMSITPHARSDRQRCPIHNPRQHFNPHSSCGEWLQIQHPSSSVRIFQSTLPMRGVTISVGIFHLASEGISIHTPHAGSDFIFMPFLAINLEFQSTLPMRGVTFSRFAGI